MLCLPCPIPIELGCSVLLRIVYSVPILMQIGTAPIWYLDKVKFLLIFIVPLHWYHYQYRLQSSSSTYYKNLYRYQYRNQARAV